MAAKRPTPSTGMTDRQRIVAAKRSQPKPQSLKTKVQNKVKEVKSAYDKVSKTPGIMVKGGPRPKMERMAQPMKPKRMAQPAKPRTMPKPPPGSASKPRRVPATKPPSSKGR
jgi:hypothetical protein